MAEESENGITRKIKKVHKYLLHYHIYNIHTNSYVIYSFLSLHFNCIIHYNTSSNNYRLLITYLMKNDNKIWIFPIFFFSILILTASTFFRCKIRIWFNTRLWSYSWSFIYLLKSNVWTFSHWNFSLYLFMYASLSVTKVCTFEYSGCSRNNFYYVHYYPKQTILVMYIFPF